MPQKMRRNFSGVFVAKHRGGNSWQLARSAPHETTVYVRDAQRDAASMFAPGPINDLGIEWHGEEALLTFMSRDNAMSVAVGSAIVHEPLSGLYASLPLMSVDARARRFWRRVFALVRMPGGRFLLQLLTRSRRPR